MRAGGAESLRGGPGEAAGLGAEHQGGEMPEAQKAHTSPQPIPGLRAERRGGEVPEAQQRHTLHLGPSSAPGKLGFQLGVLGC